MRHLAPAQGPDPMLANPPKDLISESDILCFGGAATLVPKRAVIHLPQNLAERLKFIPGSKILTWADFFAVNRGWITTVEISRAQAEGNQPMVEEIATRVNKSSNLVVATYQGSPISLLPLKAPPPAEPAAKTGGKAADKTADTSAAQTAAKPPVTPAPTGKKKP